MVLTVWMAIATAQRSNAKPTLIGLAPKEVEAHIGPPDTKDDLADSDEAFWTYKTARGLLAIHFQNQAVISFSPGDFPLETIWK
jgi:hypothetical protein